MDEWIHVVNFDDHGAFLDVVEAHPSPAQRIRDSHRSHATDDTSRLAAAVGAAASASASASALSSSSQSSLLQHSEELSGQERSLPPPPTPPSFEAFLAVPSALLAPPATRSATESATLFDIAQLAMEMDVILEAVLDQLQDRHTIQTTLATLEQRGAAATASLDTTLVVLQRQARDLNTENLVASLARMQHCLDELSDLRYLLAQHIETNHQLRQTLLHDAHCVATDDRVIALTTTMQVEQELIHRIGQLLSPEPSFTMNSLPVPALRRLSASAARVCWPMTASSSSLASASTSPPPSETFGRASADVRLSSPTSSSSVASQRPSADSQRMDSQGAQSRSHSPVVSSSASFSSSASSHTTQASSQ